MKLSVRETHKHVFPFFHYTRIFKWIQEGILVPSVHVDRPSGPPNKTMLDERDMVVCAIIHSLFRLGTEMEQLKETPVFFAGPMKSSVSQLTVKKAGSDTIRFKNVGRKWQDYLRDNDCKVIVYWAPNANENTIINVYPHNQHKRHLDFVAEISDAFRPTFGNIFINAECWLNYVEQRLASITR